MSVYFRQIQIIGKAEIRMVKLDTNKKINMYNDYIKCLKKAFDIEYSHCVSEETKELGVIIIMLYGIHRQIKISNSVEFSDWEHTYHSDTYSQTTYNVSTMQELREILIKEVNELYKTWVYGLKEEQFCIYSEKSDKCKAIMIMTTLQKFKSLYTEYYKKYNLGGNEND